MVLSDVLLQDQEEEEEKEENSRRRREELLVFSRGITYAVGGVRMVCVVKEEEEKERSEERDEEKDELEENKKEHICVRSRRRGRRGRRVDHSINVVIDYDFFIECLSDEYVIGLDGSVDEERGVIKRRRKISFHRCVYEEDICSV